MESILTIATLNLLVVLICVAQEPTKPSTPSPEVVSEIRKLTRSDKWQIADEATLGLKPAAFSQLPKKIASFLQKQIALCRKVSATLHRTTSYAVSLHEANNLVGQFYVHAIGFHQSWFFGTAQQSPLLKLRLLMIKVSCKRLTVLETLVSPERLVSLTKIIFLNITASMAEENRRRLDIRVSMTLLLGRLRQCIIFIVSGGWSYKERIEWFP